MNIRKFLLVMHYATLLALSLIFIIPLCWLISSSLQTDSEIFRHNAPVSWCAFFPPKPTLSSYINLFTDRRVPFARALLNSLVVSIITAVTGALVNAMAGFVLAKYHFKAKHLIFVLLLFTCLIPTELIVVPLYLICQSFKITRTFAGLILPSIGNGLLVLLFKQFFEDLPSAVLEAAQLDGASWWRILVSVVFPLARPAMIAGGITLLIFQWDALFWPLVVAPDERHMVIQVALSKFVGEYKTSWSIMFAGAVLAALVPAVLFLLVQKAFFTSLEGGSK